MRRFADIRKARGLSLRWAAMRLQISTGYLRSLERGRLPLPYTLAAHMASIYECGLRELTL